MSSTPDMKITSDELDKFGQAMKSSEFRDLFAEYAREISDPKNRELYEAELKELEKSRGKSIEFITPTAGFVVKTTFSKRPDEVDDERIIKCFVNFCWNDKIGSAVETKEERGSRWEVPYSLTKGRVDVDHASVPCYVYDFIVNKKTIDQCKFPRFRYFVVGIALDAIEAQFGCLVDKKYKLPKIDYKGVVSHTVVRDGALEAQSSEPKKSNHELLKDILGVDNARVIGNQLGKKADSANSGRQKDGILLPERTRTNALTEHVAAAAEEPISSETLAPLLFPSLAPNSTKSTPTTPIITELSESEVLLLTLRKAQVKPVGEVAPQYTVTEQTNIDYSEYTHDRVREVGKGTWVVVRVELPKCESIATLDLTTTSKSVQLVVPGKYRLDVKLSYEVNEEEGTAKFDKGRRVLVIKLPVVRRGAGKDGFAKEQSKVKPTNVEKSFDTQGDAMNKEDEKLKEEMVLPSGSIEEIHESESTPSPISATRNTAKSPEIVIPDEAELAEYTMQTENTSVSLIINSKGYVGGLEWSVGDEVRVMFRVDATKPNGSGESEAERVKYILVPSPANLLTTRVMEFGEKLVVLMTVLEKGGECLETGCVSSSCVREAGSEVSENSQMRGAEKNQSQLKVNDEDAASTPTPATATAPLTPVPVKTSTYLELENQFMFDID